MAEISTERLERPAAVAPLERQPRGQEQKPPTRRRAASRPQADEEQGSDIPEEAPHQLDRMA
ncbi:MAG TPA: hypothetical protein VGF06_16695 [Terriglobales bacterium]